MARALFGVGLMCLSVWLPMSFTEDIAVMDGITLALPFCLLAWALVPMREVVEILSGIDFDLTRPLRLQSHRNHARLDPLPAPPITWLRLTDLDLLRRIDAKGTVGALLEVGLRTPTPLLLDADGYELDQNQASHNERLLRAVELLEQAGFLHRASGEHRVTESGRRALALPSFFSQPQVHLELVQWLAEAEQDLHDSSKAFEAMVRLMTNLEVWLMDAIAKLALSRPHPERVGELLFTQRGGLSPRKDLRLKYRSRKYQSWLSWIEQRRSAVEDDLPSAALVLKAIGHRMIWRLQGTPTSTEAQLLFRKRVGGDVSGAALVQLFGPDGLGAEGWPRGLNEADVLHALDSLGQNTLGPLFALLKHLVEPKIAGNAPLWSWAARIQKLRNDTFHGRREPEQPTTGKDASPKELCDAYEVVWLARPLIFRLSHVVREEQQRA